MDLDKKIEAKRRLLPYIAQFQQALTMKKERVMLNVYRVNLIEALKKEGYDASFNLFYNAIIRKDEEFMEKYRRHLLEVAVYDEKLQELYREAAYGPYCDYELREATGIQRLIFAEKIHELNALKRDASLANHSSLVDKIEAKKTS